MAKQSYDELASNVVPLLGGKQNIEGVTYCATRLRFNVKDKDSVDAEAIGKLPGSLGTHWAGNQLQIIIGQAVGDAYQLVCEKNGFSATSQIDENLDGTPKKKFSPMMIIDAIAGSVTPAIPVLIGVGFLRVVTLVLLELGFLAQGDPTYTTLSFVSDSGFYFLPVLVGAAAAKKFNANPYLGAIVGAMLIHPDFVSAVANGTQLSFFGLPIYPATYSSTVIPAILSVWVMSYVERFFAKHSPESIRIMVEPFCTLFVMIPLTLCLLAPIGDFLGVYLSIGVNWIHDTFGFWAVGIYAALVPWITMTGMHHSLTPYIIQSLNETGQESFLMTANVVSNLNQGIAALVVALKTKSKQLKSVAWSCVPISLLSGISEPTMYGVTLKELPVMYAAMIGSFVGGCIAGFGGAAAHGAGVALGIIGGLPLYLGGDISNFLWILAGVGAGMLVTFAAGWILYRPQETEAANDGMKQAEAVAA